MCKVYPRVGGETHQDISFTRGKERVYPRVGGETVGLGQPAAWQPRSTPAWAGKPCKVESKDVDSGSTPAWAGKP